MPFLWKKVKSTRISQLVNDHLHNSQKRRDGSSLVVETGFPTSLIDLFIKNRQKLKNPSKKKRRNPPINDQLIVRSPSPLPNHSPPLRCPSPLHNLSVLPCTEISAVGSSVENEERAVADVNNVLFGVLRIFLVVILALGTKRLAVGITISALLLLFIDYVGRNVSLRPMIQYVSRLLRFKEIKLEEIKLDEEIQQVEETQPLIEVIEVKDSKESEEGDVIERELNTKTKSRSSKIKSKMKRYMSKKFTSSRKQECEKSSSSVSSSSSSSNSGRMYRDECESFRVGSYDEVIEESNSDNKGEHEVEGGLTWKHLVLCLIVLTGLLVGRAFALALTLSCFLLLKLGQRFI